MLTNAILSLLLSVLPSCQEEDSLNCVWVADQRGNMQGTSFININGSQLDLEIKIVSHSS